MKAKLIFSIETADIDHWISLPFVPGLNHWVNVSDLLPTVVLNEIRKSSLCWSGIKGVIQSIEYRQNDKGYYTEITIWCED